MAAMGLCKKDGDPSLLFSNPAPPARQETWREGEVVRLVKRAIRIKYPGLACAIAIAWDTQLSPVDVRKLTPAKMKADGLGSVFHVGRAKTGRAAFGTLSARTERLIRWYLGGLGFEIHVEAPLLRTRGDLRRQRGRYHQGGDRGSGRPGMPRPYTQNKLGQDFRKVRAAVFPGDNRTLADLRRSGTVEAFAGGAKPEMVSTKMADTLAASNHLFKTYNPAQVEMVRHVDDARRAGRAKLRRE
jgi:hypothetical protein